jgi:RNA polymerase sigma-70 factor (ECF subfamily)
MWRVACRILDREDLADDAVQEALIAAYQLLQLPAENPEAWLVRTVIHRCLAARRAHLRRQRNERAAADFTIVARHGASPERELAIKQLGDQIDNALRSIPAGQRRVFLLREVQGLSYEQISDLEGVPVGTVRSRLNRARSGLRDQLRGCRELPAAVRH